MSRASSTIGLRLEQQCVRTAPGMDIGRRLPSSWTSPVSGALLARAAHPDARAIAKSPSHQQRDHRQVRASHRIRLLAPLLPLRKGPWIDAPPRRWSDHRYFSPNNPFLSHHLPPPHFRLKPLPVLTLKAEG